jgi:aquaporin Z
MAMSGAIATYRIDPVAVRAPGAAASHAAVAGRKYAVELIGTFFVVFTAGVTALIGGPLAPLAVGVALMVMVYAGGHISGGHFNPAVTAAALVRGRIGTRDAVGYWVAQLVAGVLAALVARAVVNPAHMTTRMPSGRTGAALLAELLFTFALCYVVLNVATSRDQQVNSFYGLAIGFTVVAGAIAVGGISGAAFNPAVTLGAASVGLFAWSTFGLYIVAQAIAGILAGFAFRALNPADT